MQYKQIHALSAFDCADLHKDYALALEKIAKLEEQVLRVVRGEFSQICSYCGWEAPAGGASWDELQAHIHQCKEHPVYKLEERIRVADAEEPVAFSSDSLDGTSHLFWNKGQAMDLGFHIKPLYLHAQIPAEVELRAKIAELKAIIKASQEQEPYGWFDTKCNEMFFAWHSREPDDEIALYAEPVIKEQP